MSIKWTADMAANAIQEWAKNEIINNSDRAYDLLKFFFGISLSSIAAYSAILKLYKGAAVTLNIQFFVAIILYILSMVVILMAILKKQNRFDGNTDLYSEYENNYKYITDRMLIWFLLWVFGLIFSGLSIYL